MPCRESQSVHHQIVSLTWTALFRGARKKPGRDGTVETGEPVAHAAEQPAVAKNRRAPSAIVAAASRLEMRSVLSTKS